MDYRISVTWQASAPDGRAEGILSDIRALYAGPGHKPAPVRSVQISDLYFLRGDLTPAQVEVPHPGFKTLQKSETCSIQQHCN